MAKSAMPVSKAKTAHGLLSEIRKLIIAEPRRYNQNLWRSDLIDVRKDNIPACGTICCVAGWVETLTFKKVIPLGSMGFEGSPVFIRAQKKLGLTTEQARELFASGAVDRIDYKAVIGTPAYAAAGAEHIKRFQKKYAAQLKAKQV